MSTPYYQDDSLTLLMGDAVEQMRSLAAGSVNCIVTSPPYYGLRDYEGRANQIGLEDTPTGYIERLLGVFDEARRVLADDGTMWLNLGDSYYSGRGNPGPNALDGKQPARRGWVRPVDRPGQSWGTKKGLLFMPERVAMALQEAGWIVRNKIVWHKPNAMPESVQDRLSTRHETIFLLAKSARYWFDLDPIREPLLRPEALGEEIVFGGNNGGEGKLGASARRGGAHRSVYGKHGTAADTPPGGKPQTNKGATGNRHKMTHGRGRNPGDVWTIATTPLPDAHFAAFPVELPRRCILAGCRPEGTVLDPFSGAGTTALAAQQVGRRAIGIDLVAEYHDIALRRLSDAPLPFGGAA